MCAFALAIRGVHAPFHDRQIGFEQGIAHALHHGKTLFAAEFGKIVKKDTADAALFVAVLEAEIVVAPSFKARIQMRTKRRQRVTAGLVEMHCVFFKAVIRGQVHATAKPGDGFAVGRFGRQHAHIHVDRRRIRVAWMKHQRDAHGLKRRTRQLRPVMGG